MSTPAPGSTASGSPAPDLERFFHPRSVVVVGASDTAGRPNSSITARLQAWTADRGATFVPVNPNRAAVNGVPCAATVADALPLAGGAIDLAVILTGDVEHTLAEVVAADAEFAVAFGAGFAETGADGRAAQQRLADIVATGRTRLLGPNTNLNAFETFDDTLAGPAIALVTQSGHQGRPIFQAQEIGIRLSHWAPTGNEVDLEFADFVRYFADQPEVGAIAAYVEGFKDGLTLRTAADHAARQGTPICLVKVGRSEVGRSMALSHTGKLTGADAVTDAVCRQFGIHRFDGLDELLDAAQLFCRATSLAAPRPRPLLAPGAFTEPGIAVYAISGGTGAHFADLAAAAGLHLPTLSDATQAALHQWIPGYLRVSNPIDNGGHPVGDERGRMILDVLVADPDVDVLVAPITGAFPPMSDRLAQDLVDVAETTDTVICVIWGSPVGTESAYRDILLSSSKVVVFRTFGNCVTALRSWRDHRRFLSTYRSPFDDLESSVPITLRSTYSEWDAKQLIRSYGVATPLEELVTSSDEAAAAAERIGFPVVLKGCGAEVAHKTELGLVRVGLATTADVQAAYDDIVATAPMALDGVIVAETVSDGVEFVVGLSTDAVFGPVVAVGLGGTLVEVLDDVALGVPPFDRQQAHAMLDQLRGRSLLDGVRGSEPLDIEALVDVVMAVQRLALDVDGRIIQVDLNPVLVRTFGQGAIGGGAVALDALVVAAEEPTRRGMQPKT